MDTRRRELVAPDESAVVAKPALDAIAMKDSERNGCFPDTPCTNESEWFEVIGKVDNVLDQFIASEAGPGRWGR